MLRSLEIRNYLLVREFRLDFAAGLTALTGETGAGKSMIVGALDVNLGARFPKDAIGDNGDRAIVEAVFSRPNSYLSAELEIEDRTADEWIVRREISRQGRTRSFFNDRPVSLELILTLRSLLADFHGQREHQSLFDPIRQLFYLDSFARTVSDAGALSSLFGQRVALARELNNLRQTLASQLKERALLSYQLEEIERLGLRAAEEEEIEARLAKLESAEKLTVETNHLMDVLSEGDSSLASLSGQAKSIAAGIARIDREFEEHFKVLADLDSQAKDIANSIRRYAEGLSIDESELQKLRDRRGVLWDLKRKHGLSVEQILDRGGEIKLLLLSIDSLERKQSDLDKDLNRLNQDLIRVASALSSRRSAAAARMSKQILARLEPLGFPEPRFEIDVKPRTGSPVADDVTETGLDEIDFLFAANPGTKLQPISEVASGGESSRVTLAIKSVLAETMSFPLLVYDEVDLGISGRVADQVGIELEHLAKNHQMLVVTHLPQIASRADHHLFVSKDVSKKATSTSARYLSQGERIEAIASLISGIHITDKARASASELLRASGKLQTA